MVEPRAKSSLLTTHTLVLLCIARDGEMRIRDLAERVGVTERTAQTIVADLVRDGYLARARVGRRNVYQINRRRSLDHPLAADSRIGDLLEALGPHVAR
jgi:DNA-binding MarR family transcriptional regulator